MNVSFRQMCWLAVLTIPAAILVAEDRPGEQPRKAVAGAPTQAGGLDSHFAACLVLANQNEISIAKFAEQRAKDNDVKQFAQKLQKDHQQFLKELERFAGSDFRDRTDADISQPADRARAQAPATTAAPVETQQRPATAAGQRPQPPVRSGGPEGDLAQTFLQIKREIADECRASAHRELSSKQGKEFDACFVGMQIGAHWAMVDELKVLERHASPELQALLRKGRESAQMHLDHAKKLMKDVDARETAATK
ncbi:MAG: DUF4142 domain-containing protein [Planctomycetaceae bacterium]